MQLAMSDMSLPSESAVDVSIWNAQSSQHRDMAIATYRFSRALARSKWFVHQHPTDTIRVEQGSTPVHISQITNSQHIRLRALSDKLNTATAYLPQPSLKLERYPFSRSASGIHLPFPRDQVPPREMTLTSSVTPVLWKQVLAEIAAGWASIRPGLAAGLLFLGPKDRLCFWPKLLNDFMTPIPVAYGSIRDLFLVLAVCGVKIDLKSAFRSITIDIDDARFFAALANGMWIVFDRAPFGGAPCPAWFVHHLAATLDKYRGSLPNVGSALAAFVDDLGVSALSIDAVITSADRLITVLLDDGWWLSLSKAFLFPAVKLVYTGILADFTTGSISITPEKSQKFLDLLMSITIPDAGSLLDPTSGRYPNSARAIRNLASSPGLYFLDPADSHLIHSLDRVTEWVMFNDPTFIPKASWADKSIRTISSTSELAGLILDANPRIMVLALWATFAVIWDLLASIPPDSSRILAVFAFTDTSLTSSSTFEWFDPIDNIPDRFRGPWRKPLPPPVPMSRRDRLPQHSGRLSPSEWASLSRLLGMLAWFHTCLEWISHWRNPLDELNKTGMWTAAAVDSMCFLSALSHILPSLSTQIRRPSADTLTVVVDTAQMAWGAIIACASRTKQVVLAGRLPLRLALASSTAREAVGTRDATREALKVPDVTFNEVEYTVDSSALHGGATSSSSSLEASLALRSFATWQAQGFGMRWKHQRRSEGQHPLVDAISGATSAVPRWSLLWPVASFLSDLFGPFTIHLATELSPYSEPLCSRYTTSGVPSAERASILASIPFDTAFGWQGPTFAFTPARDEVAFSFPLWSELPEILLRWETNPFDLCIVAPTTPTDWWSPTLVAIQKYAKYRHDLRPRASRPPVENRNTTRPLTDPRPLTAYYLPAPNSSHDVMKNGGQGRPIWWTPYRLTECGDIHWDPGPPRPIVVSRSTAVSMPDTANVSARTPLLFSRNPTTSGSRPQSLVGSTPIVVSRSQAARESPAIPTASLIPQTTTTSLVTIPPVVGESRQPVLVSAPATTTRTMRSWATAMLAVLAMQQDVQLPPGVAPVHANAFQTSAVAHALKSNAGSAAPVKLAAMCLQFAEFRKISDYPWSLFEAEAFILDLMQSRMSPQPPLGWERVNNASQCSSDASRIAALSRAAGYQLPPYCGPSIKQWATEKGATARPEHSAAYPIHISILLARRPDPASPLYLPWMALVILSLFNLRTGIVYHLYSDMFIPYDSGYILVWRHSQKRSTDDATDPMFLSRVGAITAARHEVLHHIIRRSEPNHRLFPATLTADLMSNFVRTVLPHAPPSFDVRLYGARTAADNDATHLNMPDDLVCVLFWWKRPKLLMKTYYSTSNIAKAYAFSDRRTLISYNFITPGWCDARIPDKRLLDWDQPSIGTSLPPLPPFDAIQQALDCVSESFALVRRIRQTQRAKRARRILGHDSDQDLPDGVVEILEGSCIQCSRHIGPADHAAMCMRCDVMICVSCYPPLGHVPWYCSSHKVATGQPVNTI